MAKRRPLRAVHTSDVHLGGRGHTTLAHESNLHPDEDAFVRVIDFANETNADLLLIAGDFFDHDRVPMGLAEFATAQIERFRGVTVICPGNHDAIDQGRLYWRYDFEGNASRLRILRQPQGERISIPELDLVVWGRACLDADLSFRPLDGIPATREGDAWHIAMAHGHLVRDDHDRFRSWLIETHELEAAAGAWDYLALGHWDAQTDISVPGLTAVYSGAPLAHAAGSATTGWVSVVDFDDDGVRWAPHRVDLRGWPP